MPPRPTRHALVMYTHVAGMQEEDGDTAMATVKLLAERATPLLPCGSQVQHAFICQTGPNFAVFLINWATGLTMLLIKYYCVAVTKDAIYILDSPRMSGGANPTSIFKTLPRHTQMGPVSGRWGQINLVGQPYWVKQRFQGEVTAADREAGFNY
jgi:hypothetical protein